MDPDKRLDQKEKIDVAIEATSTLPLFDAKQQLVNCSDELFKNLKNYITSEIELTLEDYKLLEAMNHCTMEKYQGMTQIAKDVSQHLSKLHHKYEQMTPKLDIIDKLDKKVTRLEQMAYAIDAYSKRLEKQYKLLEKGLNDQQNQQLNQQPPPPSSSELPPRSSSSSSS